jgi:hypothetical protein
MTARGRRGHRPGPASPPQLVWILLVLAAALVGGLAAAALVHASLVVAVVVAVVAAAITVLALRTAPALPPGQETDCSSPATPPPRAPVPAAPVRAGEAPAPAGSQGGYDGAVPSGTAPPGDAIVQMLPLPMGTAHQPEEARSADAPWWEPAPGAVPRSSPAAKRAPAPDLSTYLASTFIAQCPSCGAFRLDIGQGINAWDFRCEACDYSWTWRPGTAWPPVRVMPTRRREPHPPAP